MDKDGEFTTKNTKVAKEEGERAHGFRGWARILKTGEFTTKFTKGAKVEEEEEEEGEGSRIERMGTDLLVELVNAPRPLQRERA